MDPNVKLDPVEKANGGELILELPLRALRAERDRLAVDVQARRFEESGPPSGDSRIRPLFRSGLILVALTLALAAAGCGGSGGTDESSQSPATTLLESAGLQICSEGQSTAAAWYGTGFVQGRSFVVAPDCENAPAVPTTVYGLTYKDNDTADTAAKSIQKTHPKDQVLQPTVAPYTTTVIVVEGPKSTEYATSLQAALPKG